MMKNYFLIAMLVVLAACSRPQEHLMEQITVAEKELGNSCTVFQCLESN